MEFCLDKLILLGLFPSPDSDSLVTGGCCFSLCFEELLEVASKAAVAAIRAA